MQLHQGTFLTPYLGLPLVTVFWFCNKNLSYQDKCRKPKKTLLQKWLYETFHFIYRGSLKVAVSPQILVIFRDGHCIYWVSPISRAHPLGCSHWTRSPNTYTLSSMRLATTPPLSSPLLSLCSLPVFYTHWLTALDPMKVQHYGALPALH
jgi:hypothetical protein